jgi:hypothetical protein
MKITPKEHKELIKWSKDNYHTKVGTTGNIKSWWQDDRTLLARQRHCPETRRQNPSIIGWLAYKDNPRTPQHPTQRVKQKHSILSTQA